MENVVGSLPINQGIRGYSRGTQFFLELLRAWESMARSGFGKHKDHGRASINTGGRLLNLTDTNGSASWIYGQPLPQEMVLTLLSAYARW